MEMSSDSERRIKSRAGYFKDKRIATITYAM